MPLIAGIGSALAITVLPALVNWLESLNDIETKFSDISSRITRNFSDLKFRVDLEADERRFRRTIDQAKELQDVLNSLRDVAQSGEDKKIDLQKLFGDPRVLKDQKDAIQQLWMRESSQRTNLLSRIDCSLKTFNLDLVMLMLGNSFKNLKNLEQVNDSLKQIFLNVRDVQSEGQKGIFDVEKLNRISDDFFKIEGVYKVLKDSDLANPEQVDSLKATIEALRSTVEDYRKAAQELESFNNQLVQGLEAARRKTRELAQEQILVAGVILVSSTKRFWMRSTSRSL